LCALGCASESDVEGASCDGQQHPCPDGYLCVEGTCFEEEPVAGIVCNDDSDCPAGVCLPQSHICVGCIRHSDCVSRLCETKTHICLGCKADYQCPSGSCDESLGICEDIATGGDA
jgi:hypothetical protein